MRLALSFAAIAVCHLAAPSALAQTAGVDAPPPAALVARHLVSVELAPLLFAKAERLAFGFGAAYSYRVSNGVELGAGLRYVVLPANTTDLQSAPAAPQPGVPEAAPEYYVEPSYHQGFGGVSVRGFIPLDREDRFELGLTGRVGLVVNSGRSGICCAQFAVAPDLRIRLASNTALQIAPEVAIGANGTEDRGGDTHYIDEAFLQFGAWASVVQSF